MPDRPKPVKPLPQPKRPRPTTTDRGYGADHQRWRREALLASPLCPCGDFAVEAHHLRYPARGPEDYQALCWRCHRQITVRDRRAGR
jgi:hypothetical protein